MAVILDDKSPVLVVMLVCVAFVTGCFDLNPPTACGRDKNRCTTTQQDAGADTMPDADAAVPPPARPEETCARLTACNQGVGAIDFVGCLRLHLFATEADRSGHPLAAASVWRCLDAARSCTDVAACSDNALSPTACAGAGGGTAKVCVGSNVVTCTAAKNVGAELCGLHGRSCIQITPTSAACAASNDCPTESPACKGTRLIKCEGSIDKGSRCAELGGICAPTDGGAGCTGDDPPCDADLGCSGTVARVCRFGREAKFDCAAFNATCDSTPSDAGSFSEAELRLCRPAGSECSDADEPACEGTDVRYCLGARRQTIACVSLGLRACQSAFSLRGSTAACGAP